LAPGGDLDREALASIVFADPAARRDLEAIVHPEVRRMFAEGTEEHRDSNRVVVFSAPLLVETGMHTAFEVLLVVSTTVATQVERLMRDRGMSEDAVRARIAAQAPLEDKAAVADVLIDNEGSIEQLEAQVERAWAGLATRRGG
jgi:dephospho-CoA kinase